MQLTEIYIQTFTEIITIKPNKNIHINVIYIDVK